MSRRVAVALVVLGVAGAMSAGALTAMFTAEHVHVVVTGEPVHEFEALEPQEFAAHIE